MDLDIYQNAINQLLPLTKVVNSENIVRRAIEKLKRLAADSETMENEFEKLARIIYPKMLNENGQNTMTSQQKAVFITTEYINSRKFGEQHFNHFKPGIVTLAGYGTEYVFKYYYDWKDQTCFTMKRLANELIKPPRKHHIRSYDFNLNELPKLKDEDGEQLGDIFLIKKILKGLDEEIGLCWKRINVSHSPSIAETLAPEDETAVITEYVQDKFPDCNPNGPPPASTSGMN